MRAEYIFPNSIDSSEHRRGGSLRREPRLSKNNLLDSGGSAERLRDVLINPSSAPRGYYKGLKVAREMLYRTIAEQKEMEGE